MVRRVLTTIFVQVASYASVIGMYFTFFPIGVGRPGWHWALITAIALITLAIIVFEIRDHYNAAPKAYKSEKKINEYMCRWVAAGGRVVIFSRDMSWARGKMVQNVLSDKAKRNELTICLEKDIPLTDDLKSKGANIITYGRLGHIPKSRFTIVDFEKEGARVAVGIHEIGKQVIQEFRSGAHPFFAVSEDMVKFLLKAGQNGVS